MPEVIVVTEETLLPVWGLSLLIPLVGPTGHHATVPVGTCDSIDNCNSMIVLLWEIASRALRADHRPVFKAFEI